MPKGIYKRKEPTNLEERFWSKVDIRGENECWLWKAGTNKNGYGSFGIGGHDAKNYNAHRIAWKLANGRDQRKGFVIAHAPIICHNRLCCNPAHLSEKTHKENEMDKHEDKTDNRGERHPLAKLSQTEVDQIREMLAQKISSTVIGKIFGVDKSHVCKIGRRTTWK